RGRREQAAEEIILRLRSGAGAQCFRARRTRRAPAAGKVHARQSRISISMDAYLIDWLNLLVRWLHLIAGIAWIGASFYFVMLDNSLSPPKRASDRERGVTGAPWAVHSGGFYVSQKFLLGPKGEPLSDDLHWSKWEAYTTWLSGMGLLAIIYWWGASTYLIDNAVMPLTPLTAIGISIGSLAAGWLIYDGLCRGLIGRDSLLAAIIL